MGKKQIANWYAQYGRTKNAHTLACTDMTSMILGQMTQWSQWLFLGVENLSYFYSSIFSKISIMNMYSICYFKKKVFTILYLQSNIFLKTLVLEYNLFSKAWGEVSKNLSLSGLKYLYIHNVLNKTQPHFSIWKHLPTNISNKILSDLGDTIKPIKLLTITIPDSGLWKYPQMFLFPPGRPSIKKALCSAHLGSTCTKKDTFQCPNRWLSL